MNTEDKSLIPTTYEGLKPFSADIIKSPYRGCAKTATDALFAIVYGKELGISPMQSLQNIAVINGKPAVWGDAMIALCMNSGLLEDINESFSGEFTTKEFKAVCVVKRKGMESKVTREFSVQDAIQAGLWTLGDKQAVSGKIPALNPKDSRAAWSGYPKRMLQMRARSWALRDGFSDVLQGIIAIEEAMDFPDPDKKDKTQTVYEKKQEPVTVPEKETPIEDPSEIKLNPKGRTIQRITLKYGSTPEIKQAIASYMATLMLKHGLTEKELFDAADKNKDKFDAKFGEWLKENAKQQTSLILG